MTQPFFTRHGFTIVLVTVFLMPFIGVGTIRALRTNRNEVKDWLPEDFPETAVHSWFNAHFPHEQFVLASWEGCTLDDPRLELFAQKLENFDADLEDLGVRGRAAEVLRRHGLDRRKAILDHEKLLGDLVRLGELGESEAEAIHRRAERWQSPFKTPVLTGGRLVEMIAGRYTDLSEEEVLARLEGSLFGEDRRKTCLIVTIAEAGKGKQLRHTLESIRKVARQCGIEPPPPKREGNLLVRAVEFAATTLSEVFVGRTPETRGVRLGGPPVDNVAIDVEGERTLYRLAVLSAIVGLTISWFCFHSMRLTFLVFFTALLAAGTSLAIVAFTGFILPWATVDAIMLTMPSLVYVLAISGAIHIVNYYHDAIHETGLERAPEQAIAHGFWPCTIAALTTAVGLGSLWASHVVPISKFGLFSAAAVLATLLLIFLFLPACLYFFPSRKYAEEHACHCDDAKPPTRVLMFWRRVGGGVVRRNAWVSIACTAAIVFFGAGVFQIRTSIKLMKLFSPDAQIIADYAWLEEHLGPLVPMEVVIRFDPNRNDLNFVDRMRLVEQVERSIEHHLEDVGGALSASTFAPDISPETRKPTVFEIVAGIDPRRVRDDVLSQQLEKHREEFREYLAIDKASAVADETSDPELGTLGIFGPAAERLAAAGLGSLRAIERFGDPGKPLGERLRAVGGLSADEAEAVAEAVARWRHDHRDPTLDELGIPAHLADQLRKQNLETLLAVERLGDPARPLEERLAALGGIGPGEAAEVAAAIDRWRTERGDELWRVSARVRALSDLDYGYFIDDVLAVVEPLLDAHRQHGVEGVDAVYTGLVPLVYKTQHELMRGLFNSLAMAFGLIALVMMVVLRNPAAGLLAMLPNLFPVAIVFGFMGWTGVLVDIGTMMTASVALGVAVDDTIHYLTWFRQGLDSGLDRNKAAGWAYERCATAMTQTTLIAGLGLAAFAFSTFTPTQRFGLLMLAILAVALVGDLIYLPSLLTGPLGRTFRWKSKRGPAPQPGAASPPGPSGEPRGAAGAEEGDEAVVVPISGNQPTRQRASRGAS
jgi:uncharacterized protein